MYCKEIITTLAKNQGVNMTQLGKVVGKSTQNMSITFSTNHSKSLRVDTMAKLLGVLGYKLVVVPQAQSVKNGYEVTE